ALVVQPVRLAGEREEVVPVEQDVHAEVLGLGDGAADAAVVGVLRLELDADAYGPGSHDHSVEGVFLSTCVYGILRSWRCPDSRSSPCARLSAARSSSPLSPPHRPPPCRPAG